MTEPSPSGPGVNRPIRYAVADGVATITLARPDAGNAMNMAFMDALHGIATAITNDTRLRAVLIEAEGRHFCVGGDLIDVGGDDPGGAYMRRLAGRLHEAIKLLAAQQVPIVVAVQGAAAGAGLSLVALADVALAARSARFTLAYAGIGLTADGGATWLLPRVIGLRRTQELAFTGRRLTADEAERYGVVTRVVDDAVLAQEAGALATRIAAGPTAAYGAVRRLLAAQGGVTFADHLDAELDAIATARAGVDAQEGVAAFMERRSPNFTGR